MRGKLTPEILSTAEKLKTLCAENNVGLLVFFTGKMALMSLAAVLGAYGKNFKGFLNVPE